MSWQAKDMAIVSRSLQALQALAKDNNENIHWIRDAGGVDLVRRAASCAGLEEKGQLHAKEIEQLLLHAPSGATHA